MDGVSNNVFGVPGENRCVLTSLFLPGQKWVEQQRGFHSVSAPLLFPPIILNRIK